MTIRMWAAAVVALAIFAAACRDSTGVAPAATPPADVALDPSTAAPVAGPVPDPSVEQTIAAILSTASHPGLTWNVIADVVADLQPLYDAEPDKLLWFDGTHPVSGIERTLAALAAAGDHGLDPAHYESTVLGEQWAAMKAKPPAAPDRALFDVGLSVATARLLRAVHLGRVDPTTMDWGYHVPRKVVDHAALLREVRDGKGLAATLDALQPPVAHYTRARATLAAYKALARGGEPESIPDLAARAPSVKPGASWPGTPALAARLRVFGDLPRTASMPADPLLYTGALVDAVKAFQARHGLETDGALGRGTIRALNVPVARRVRQIELAMERMRWLPDLGDQPEAVRAQQHDVEAAVLKLLDADQLADAADPVEAGTVALVQGLDHCDPSAAGERILDHCPIAFLEDVQGQLGAREEDCPGEREQRHARRLGAHHADGPIM